MSFPLAFALRIPARTRSMVSLLHRRVQTPFWEEKEPRRTGGGGYRGGSGVENKGGLVFPSGLQRGPGVLQLC